MCVFVSRVWSMMAGRRAVVVSGHEAVTTALVTVTVHTSLLLLRDTGGQRTATSHSPAATEVNSDHSLTSLDCLLWTVISMPHYGRCRVDDTLPELLITIRLSAG